ncbi:unnamed protein product [Euphydryas editha]|uniref:ABC transporter domain-containing protein n=1 Tax=Euphydryas editha TaxID=104508 RepID=A0AAU9VAS9_EUPED|nr:unnamed protein product [Euphydryas editha]
MDKLAIVCTLRKNKKEIPQAFLPDTLHYTHSLHYTQRHKTILNELSGQFNAGELSIIVGQSGAGKSSLLDILSGYTKPTSGRIYVNGRTRNVKTFRRRSCYVLQDDKVHDMLTVQESLKVAAELKLGNHVSGQQKQQRIEEIITSLGLSQTRNTRAGNLSGGQKKRLAIGLELVSDPPIMFLDEPTSGLDCSISMQLIYLLHLLARQGRTMVISMHQPSTMLLHMVDRLYAIVAGRCAYMGSVSSLLPYLREINLICPPYHNPVDFFPEQIPVIRREHFNRWYNTGAYYSSTLVAALPTQTVCTLSFTFITYWLTGQPIDYKRFIIYCSTLVLVSYVSLCVGLFNGSLFSVKNGVIFGPFFIMPFTIFSGFFLRYDDAPFFIQWLFHLSFLKHGLIGLVIAIFGMDRPKLPCTDLYCHYTRPVQFLKDNGMLGEQFSVTVVALCLIGFVFIAAAYVVLKVRLKRKW